MTQPKRRPFRATDENLTEKQQKFIDLYNGENLSEAVLGAGFKCTNEVVARLYGNQLLRNEKIMRHITGADYLEKRKDIADKTERMVFLTHIMRDEKQPVLARIRACELMGKAMGDYVERHEIDVNENVLVLSKVMTSETVQIAKELTRRLIDPYHQTRPKEAKPVLDVEILEDARENAVCAQ